ncbi:MAG: FHA domain-containing protein [Planctomycetota bacterium]|nr:MAG: FHA domain-containing protein [Planctomycetota bacterium]
MITLLLRLGNNPVAQEFSGDSVTIGRALTNHLVIGDSRVSRVHARIERTEAGIRIVDLNSGNGTWLNGQKIESEDLLVGDRLRIGTMPLRVVNIEISDAPKPSTSRRLGRRPALAVRP